MERPYTSKPHLWNERPSFDWSDWHVLPICSTIINGECGLMELLRKTHILYVSSEGWFRDLTQRLVHGIVPQAFTRRVLISISIVVLLIIGKRLARQSSGSLSITSTIYLLGGQLGVGRWMSSPYVVQFPFQLIDFTLHVSTVLCMGNTTLPSRLAFTSMRCVHTSLTIFSSFEAPTQITMLRPPWFCLV